MFPSRCLRQSAQTAQRTARAPKRLKTSPATKAKPLPRKLLIITALGTAAAIYQYQSGNQIFRNVYAEAPPPEQELKFEKPRKTGLSKEDNRDLISSQHLQVKRSWENPGVYAWGSNAGKVVAPDSQESMVKTPRRIPFFDGVLLRDLKMDRNFGAAINEKGDLLQWGTGYDKENASPAVTLKGKNLKALTISRDRIIGLSSSGKVYSVPVSKIEQQSGPKVSESSWIPFWSSKSPISYRIMQPENMSFGETISAVAGGLEHVLLLTNKGRLFSSAASAQDFPSKGQLGIPGLTWNTRPSGAYDQCHEIMTLRGFNIAKIAAGDYHSLAADKDGRVFSFGDNSFGQLGFDHSPDSAIVDAPSLLPITRLYAGTGLSPKVTSVAAGGTNSYFTIDATKIASPTDNPHDANSSRGLGRITADTWACGQGIWGNLANGRWTHVQSTPVKIPALSGLFEWDEKAHRAVPIRLRRFSVGQNHAAAVMDNVTYVDASGRGTENETNWGADILFFGNNQHYQIGTGKRNNVSNPIYLQPLDQLAERKVRGKEEHRFQITPRKRVKVNGRWVDLEQRVECGRDVTAVYSGV
ncbi:RCC1/BLIP-II [Saccharata proteae CBS 121410]|uniref:RCC1/BLIP-II n=1 Tax=Saccharata proteae CBS 121410 TaxID=1314787 RepID=A0A9P4HPY4_9PEZI|nr:RCC1/BLIP-II [Saccharata proteae CBS 121410]